MNLALLLGATLASGTVNAAPDDAPVLSALTACIGSSPYAIATPSDLDTVPPGLIPGRNVHIVALPRSVGKAVSYEGTGNAVMCGVAIYGPVSTKLRRALILTIEHSAPEMRRRSPDFFRVSDANAKKLYWGQPLAPGMTGIMMLERRPTSGAPTIEVQYHNLPFH